MTRVSKRKMRIPYLWTLLICVAAGCGSGAGVAPVKGRVTLDGKPLDTVDIVFQPEDGKPPATSRTDTDGNYELLYKRGVMGAPVGQHTVRIGFTSGAAKNPPNIPARYNTATELHREVKSGKNELDFELKSDGK